MTAALICHARDCTAPAVLLCDACEHPCCATHAQRVVLERRQDLVERPGHRDILARVPSYTASYMLCPRCAKRPFDGISLRGLRHPSARS